MNKLCRLCQMENITQRYEGPIRAGSYGKWTSESYSIWDCSNCGVGFVTPVPDVDYETDQYRFNYNESAVIGEYFSLHDRNQIQYLEKFKKSDLRNKDIADFGCGGGSFLDYVAGLARKTIAVEPFIGYHPSLLERGHQVYQYGADLLKDVGNDVIDIAVSLHVIEHVPDPLAYLGEIFASLVTGDSLYLVTPNYNDILLKLSFDAYAPFFYRTAHLWYYNATSLRWLASKVGFSQVLIDFQHNYDLSNAFCWVRDGKPSGLGSLPLFDSVIDATWRAYLESTGQADVVWATMRK